MSTTASPSRATRPTSPSVAVHVAALVVYVVLGFVFKAWLLNWIVGPLFLVLVLHVVPMGVRRLRGRVR